MKNRTGVCSRKRYAKRMTFLGSWKIRPAYVVAKGMQKHDFFGVVKNRIGVCSRKRYAKSKKNPIIISCTHGDLFVKITLGPWWSSKDAFAMPQNRPTIWLLQLLYEGGYRCPQNDRGCRDAQWKNQHFILYSLSSWVSWPQHSGTSTSPTRQDHNQL